MGESEKHYGGDRSGSNYNGIGEQMSVCCETQTCIARIRDDNNIVRNVLLQTADGSI